MGAGENTLFEIFSIMYACQGSLLLVIDEIELGLHEAAQVRLIRELNALCAEQPHSGNLYNAFSTCYRMLATGRKSSL
jgi:hypothetical protein